MGTLYSPYYGMRLGTPITAVHSSAATYTSYSMATLNTGCCWRFTARTTKDIKSVRIRWSGVTAAGAVQLTIETIDSTTGKPTGTLYDANASYNITPVAGVQTYTFATLPTTGLTIGTEYGIVLLTTTGGTTQTVVHSNSSTVLNPSLPSQVLTAADGTTRSNFAELSGGRAPIFSLVDEDDNEIEVGNTPYHNYASAINLYGDNVMALKIVLPSNINYTVKSMELNYMIRTGTPAGNLRVRIFDGTNSVVTGSTIELDKDSIGNINALGAIAAFDGGITLSGGTYRLAVDSPNSANSSNCYTSRYAVAFNSSCLPSSVVLSTSTDGGTNWTDDSTQLPPIGLQIGNFSASAVVTLPPIWFAPGPV